MKSILSLLILLCTMASCQKSVNEIDLSGQWQFAIDSLDQGLDQKWFSREFDNSILLPGSMTERGLGNEPDLNTPWTGSIYDSSWYYNPYLKKYRKPDKMTFPFWLTPNKYYVGPAWYSKKVTIPNDWESEDVTLVLERAHWETLVWVDGVAAGMQNSLSVPHYYNLSSLLTPGDHTITVRVDNRTKEINVGPDSHSITDHTQGNWNGLVGELKLVKKSPLSIKEIRVYPNVDKNMAQLKIVISGPKADKSTLLVSADAYNTEVPHRVKAFEVALSNNNGIDTISVDLPMGESVQLWDEFSPVLYNLSAQLKTEDKVVDESTTTFGMRKVEVAGTQFKINGRKTFLRGNLDCCIFPLTGYPPATVKEWVKIFKKTRDYGLNHVRFHSYCPPKAAFIAADSLGIYLQVEGPSWANHGTALGYGEPIDKYLMEETDRILKEYGNHPSFCFMAYGNEPRGRYTGYLTKWIKHCKASDNTKLYTGASIGRSWKITPNSEFIVRSEARGLPWEKQPQTEFDYLPKVRDYAVPYVTHEMGQYCVYPNFKELPKYTGVMRARNFEMFKEQLVDNHMGHLADTFLMASGMMQVECYKQEIEATMRTPEFAGFQLLQLNDFPGQGSAIIGMLDAFFDEKGYIDEKGFKAFCDATVPLTRFPKFTYKNSETLKVPVEVAHFDKEALKGVVPSWKIRSASGIFAEGKFDKTDIAIGNGIKLGKVEVVLSSSKEAQKLTLEVDIDGHINSWDFWVYPDKLSVKNAGDVYVTDKFDQKTKSYLAKGKKVLLLASGKIMAGKEVEQHLKPAFWNTSWFKMRPPHTTGVFVRNDHPVFDEFPTDYYSDLQWWELIHKQQVMILDHMTPKLEGMVQPIDTWFINRRLASLFEAKVAKGKLVVCSADISSDLDKRIVARQMYYSILKYMNSDKFNPEVEISTKDVDYLFDPTSTKTIQLYTKDSPDELKPTIH